MGNLVRRCLGLGLFESDYELDFVDNLDDEAGLRKLQGEAVAKAEASKPAKSADKKDKDNQEDNPSDDDDNNNQIYYTMWGGGSDQALVRKHMDEGALQTLIDKYTAKSRGHKDKKERFPPDYTLVMLCACAMSLGCTLPPDFKLLVKRLHLHVNLMTIAVKQMRKALGPDGYKEGEPYRFEIAKEDELPEPQPGPSGMISLNVMGKGVLFEPRVPAPKFPDEVCGGCGASEGEGENGGLMTCAKCKKRKYCSKECQKIHWGVHKKGCKAPA